MNIALAGANSSELVARVERRVRCDHVRHVPLSPAGNNCGHCQIVGVVFDQRR